MRWRSSGSDNASRIVLRKRREAGFAEPTGPVTKTEACELLGVDPGCFPKPECGPDCPGCECVDAE